MVVAPALVLDFAGHRKECNPLDIGGSAACLRQLSRQFDRLAMLRFGVIDLDLEHRETPLQISGRLRGCLFGIELPLNPAIHKHRKATCGKVSA